MSQRSGVLFSSCFNENVIQPGQEFLTRSSTNANCFIIIIIIIMWFKHVESFTIRL